MKIAGGMISVICVFLCFGVNPVSAQTVIGEDSGQIEWNGWQLEYEAFEIADGLHLSKVSYDGNSIIKRASFPVMSVFYDGICGSYADRLAGAAQPVPWANNELLVAREFTQNGERWFELGVRDFIGSYDIYQVWYFSENGALDAHVFSRGLQCEGFHAHYPMWRIDFDINGSGTDRIRRATGPDSFETMVNEFQAPAASAFQHGWFVEDTVTGTRVRIDFDNGAWNVGGAVVPETSYSDNAIGAMNYAGYERTWTGGASRDFPYINGERIDNQDLTLWYRGYMPHYPDEGSALWHSTGIRMSIINEQTDYDADGIPDSVDTDDDNDGVPDVNDDLPRNPGESVDTDADGAGNNADIDDDNDGYPDIDDEFPLDPNRWQDNTNSVNLIKNGSFEDGLVGPGVAPTYWSISGTGGRNNSNSRASDGSGYYAIGGWGVGRDGVISQIVPTQAGQSYSISFATGKYAGQGVTPLLRVEALNGQNSVMSNDVQIVVKESHTYIFTATSNSTTIRFSDVTQGTGPDYDIDLDAIVMAKSGTVNILRNGSFEEGQVGPGAAPTYWSIAGTGGRDEFSARASDGVGYYALGGWGLRSRPDSVISQTVPTQAGQNYTLTFDSIQSFGQSVSAVLRIDLLDASNEIIITDDISMSSTRTNHEYTFTARGSTTAIRFQDKSMMFPPEDYDIDLDAVAVTPQPRP